MRLRPLGLLLAVLLSGCAATSNSPPASGHAMSQGRLVLNQVLTIPANAASVRLQYGRVVAMNAVQEQDPFCIFEIETVAPGEQSVRPDSFDITRIFQSIETFAGMPVFRPMRVGLGNDSDGPSQIYYKTTFRLRDDAQGARSLVCMSNQYMPGISIMRHLTQAEIRQALGRLFTLEFPA